MLSRISDVLQTAADVLAPPATRFEDFEYHWKQILNFYNNYDDSQKLHIEETKIPHHLNQMLQLIIEEEKDQSETIGPCVESVMSGQISLVWLLAMLVAGQRPVGARSLALTSAALMLRRGNRPGLDTPHVYKPLQRMLIQCSEVQASPTEKEEMELLLTLCGLVRKDPALANIFTTPFIDDKNTEPVIPEEIKILLPKQKRNVPKRNKLFEIEPPSIPLTSLCLIRNDNEGSGNENAELVDDNASCQSNKTLYDENDKFLLIDLLLNYLNSADNQVVVRACEGILIVSSLPHDDIANLITSSPICENIVEKLCERFKYIPANVDPCDVHHLNITWGFVAEDFGDKNYNKYPGYKELTNFFSWLDYCDTLMKECHPMISTHLARIFRQHFLETGVENGLADLRHAVLVTAILGKALAALDSHHFISEFSNWLVGDGEICEWPLLLNLINNCLTNHHELTLETLKFFETIIEKPTAHSIQRLVLAKLSTRGYYASETQYKTECEEDRDRLNDVSIWRERERNREAMKQLKHEEQVTEHIHDILTHEGVDSKEHTENGDNIEKVINSFLLVLPRAILSDPVGADYQQYIHDAHRHYQIWLDATCSFNWPTDPTWDTTASSTHSYDSRPEADIHLHDTYLNTTLPHTDTTETEPFDEGPFLKMLYKLLLQMPTQPYQVNLHLTSIISKLALMPHPYLHEYLLNPMLPVAKNTQTLYKVLQELAARLAVEIPKLKNYKTLIENTRSHLLSEDPSYDETNDHNQLVESLIVVEEFCKEIAAIAFVKYQHSTCR